MAINKKLLHFATKTNFSTQLANSNIDSRSIVFIKDTGEIWTHDKLYSCASWGTNQTNYVPLTIGGTSYNLSKNGHTHSYLPLTGGTLTGELIIAPNIGIRTNGNAYSIIYNDVTTKNSYLGAQEATTYIRSGNTDLYHRKNGSDYKIWDSSNDGAGSGLDADLLDGLNHTSFLRCDSTGASDVKNGNFAIGVNDTRNFIQSHSGKPLYINELGNLVYINNILAATINSNVASATKLQTARTIAGVSFNGTANISIPFANLTDIPSTFAPSPHNHENIVNWSNAQTTAQTYSQLPNGVSVAFTDVGGGYGSYGSVLNIKAYPSSGGGTLQLYIPYSNTHGGTGLKYRKFNYAGDWGSLNTIWDSGNLTNLNQLTTRNFSDLQNKPTTLSGYGVTDFTSHNSSNGLVADNSLVNAIGYTPHGSVSLFGQDDGGLINTAYSSTWQSQIFQDFRTGQIALRGKNNGTWTSWRTVWDSGNLNNLSQLTTRNFSDILNKPTTLSGYGITDGLFTEQVSVAQTDDTWVKGYASSKNRALVYNTSGLEWGYLFNFRNDVSYGAVLATSYSNNTLKMLSRNAGTWSSWVTFLHSGNYTSYSPSLTGTGASGTWGINITGNAGSVDGQNFTYSNSSNSPTYLWATDSSGSSYLAARGSISVNYANSAGSITGFTSGWSNSGEHNANNISSNGMWYYTSNGPTIAQGSSTNDGALYSQAHSTTWVAQIAQDYRNGRLFVRGKNNGTWKSWLNILDSDNSSVSGNTITINGTSTTWVNTHRGIQNNLTSQNNTTESLSAHQGYLLANGSARDNTKLALSGGTVTGTLMLSKNTPSGTAYSSLAMEVRSSGGHPVGIGFHRVGYTQTILSHEGSGLVVRSSTISTGALAPITASTFVGALSGNASSASKLTTTTAGSATRPVYFANGIPVAGTYTFGNASGNAAISNGTVCTNLNADLLDGYNNGALTAHSLNNITSVTNANQGEINGSGYNVSGITYWRGTNSTSNIPSGSSNAWGIINLGMGGNHGASYQYAAQIYVGTQSNKAIYFRNQQGGLFRSWEQFAFLSDNVASATKLQTSRTLWGQSFNGEANVSGALTGVSTISASGNIITSSKFINTKYSADAILLAGGGTTTLSGLYKHCCTWSIGVGSEIVTPGLFMNSTISYYPTKIDTVKASVVTLTFSVPASLPTLNEATIKNGTYKIDVTSYSTNQNGYEDRAWYINSIGTNSVVIILSGTWLNANEGFIISVTKRI